MKSSGTGSSVAKTIRAGGGSLHSHPNTRTCKLVVLKCFDSSSLLDSSVYNGSSSDRVSCRFAASVRAGPMRERSSINFNGSSASKATLDEHNHMDSHPNTSSCGVHHRKGESR